MYPNITNEAVREFIEASEKLHGMIPQDEQFLLTELNDAYAENEKLRETNLYLKSQLIKTATARDLYRDGGVK